MKPLSEIMILLRSTTAGSFSDRHPNQDAVLIEPYEKGRSYGPTDPIHAQGKVMFLPKTVGKPVPVGRDARSIVLLDHPAVSRLHLVIAYTAQGWKVMDRSSNGSWLTEVRMTGGQAVPMEYGVAIRMGRALMIRLFTLEGFHNYARSAPQSGAGPAGRSPSDPQADTWRFPSPAVAPPVAPPSTPQPAFAPPTTQSFRSGPPPPPPPPAHGGGFAPVAPRPPGGGLAPSPPSPPKPPTPPKKTVSDGDMEFDFDFDFDSDNRGGFA